MFECSFALRTRFLMYAIMVTVAFTVNRKGNTVYERLMFLQSNIFRRERRRLQIDGRLEIVRKTGATIIFRYRIRY